MTTNERAKELAEKIIQDCDIPCHHEPMIAIFASDALRAQREEALEEAAKIAAHDWKVMRSCDTAENIRALKTQTGGGDESTSTVGH